MSSEGRSFWDSTDDRFEVVVFEDEVHVNVYPSTRTKWSDGRPNTVVLSHDEARELGAILLAQFSLGGER